MKSEFHQQKTFDQQAKVYEKLYGSDSEFEREIVEKRKNLILSSPNSENALDLGCGTGTFLKEISEKSRVVFAVDVSKQMLIKALEKKEKEKLSNTTVLLASAIDLPFEENFFDTVYCINTFYHIKEKEKALSEMSRVLKKNGRAYIEFYNVVNPFVFFRALLNPFVKTMPFVYPDCIPALKKQIGKNGLTVRDLKVFSFVETSQAVKQWLPNVLFNLLVSYRAFSEKHTFLRLPKTRCVFEVEKI